MAIVERDPHTGYLTTGHEWNGIKELNTPVPRPVYVFLIATALFAVAYWVLMPAWPTGEGYTKGLLGIDQRTSVADSLRQAASERAGWLGRVEAGEFDDVLRDRPLMEQVRQTGRVLFGDNCAACHGRNARGGHGFPDLTTSSWLWGGAPETIAETIRVGINSTHPDSRVSQMPAFGRSGMLPRADIEKVAAYVRALSAPPSTKEALETIAASGAIFAANCASCHGDDGKGSTEAGAPNLADGDWLYGGDMQSVFMTIWHGRQGQMPSWEARLTVVEQKILVLYLTSFRSAGP
jgi:cytochrome c oxidase cbb3-type subunit 3